MELAAVIAFLNSPIGAAAVVLLGLFAPKVSAVLGPLLNLLKKGAPASTPTAPTAPATPTAPAPEAPALPAVPEIVPNRPLINLGLKLLGGILAKKNGTTEHEAIEKFIMEKVSEAHAHADAPATPAK